MNKVKKFFSGLRDKRVLHRRRSKYSVILFTKGGKILVDLKPKIPTSPADKSLGDKHDWACPGGSKETSAGRYAAPEPAGP